MRQEPDNGTNLRMYGRCEASFIDNDPSGLRQHRRNPALLSMKLLAPSFAVRNLDVKSCCMKDTVRLFVNISLQHQDEVLHELFHVLFSVNE